MRKLLIKRYQILTISNGLLLNTGSAIAQYHQFVDPLIGSEGLGNVFIGPSCPYGMVKPGPDIDKGANSGCEKSPKPV